MDYAEQMQLEKENQKLRDQIEHMEQISEVHFINPRIQEIVDDLNKRGLHPLSLLESILDCACQDPIQVLRVATVNMGYKVDF